MLYNTLFTLLSVYRNVSKFSFELFWLDSGSCCIRQFLPGPEVIKLFSCSTQLSMKFFLLINIEMPTIVGILRFMSRKNSSIG